MRIEDAPQASRVQSFFCANPKCNRVHVVLFDYRDEPFAQFVMPDVKADGTGFFTGLQNMMYESAVKRGK